MYFCGIARSALGQLFFLFLFFSWGNFVVFFRLGNRYWELHLFPTALICKQISSCTVCKNPKQKGLEYILMEQQTLLLSSLLPFFLHMRPIIPSPPPLSLYIGNRPGLTIRFGLTSTSTSTNIHLWALKTSAFTIPQTKAVNHLSKANKKNSNKPSYLLPAHPHVYDSI